MKIFNKKENDLAQTENYDDRRTDKRLSVIQEKKVSIVIGGGTIISSNVVEISRFGANVKTNLKLNPKETVTLKVAPGQLLYSTVTWSRRISDEEIYEASLEFEKEWEDFASVMADYIDASELREHERKSPGKAMSVEVSEISGKNPLVYIVTIVDISKGGVKIKGSRVMKKGTKISMKFSDNCLKKGEIRWCSQVDENKTRKNFIDISTGQVKWYTESADVHRSQYFAGIKFLEEEIAAKEDKIIPPKKQKHTITSPHADYYNRLGIQLRKEKKYEEAVLNYRTAIKIEPDNEILYFNYARVYMDEGGYKKARELLEKAVEIYPDFEEAKNLINFIKDNPQ